MGKSDDRQGEREGLYKFMDAKCRELMSRFDTVQIVCTVHDAQEGTETFAWGLGNWHARESSVEFFLRRERIKDEVRIRKCAEEDLNG